MNDLFGKKRNAEAYAWIKKQEKLRQQLCIKL